MTTARDPAPGGPGLPPTWSSSDKDFVTTALGASRLWVTIGHGVLNEVYWPSTGQPRLRDLTFYLVGETGWIDLKRVREYELSRPGDAIPLLTVTHRGTGPDGTYALELEIIPDADRDCVLVRYRIDGPYRLVVIASPHLDGSGAEATAWRDPGEDCDLLAEAGDRTAALCLAARDGFAGAGVGYVGASDGWQDLDRNGRLTWQHDSAGPGNVALTGGLEGAEGVLALALDGTASGARLLARAALAEGCEAVRARFVAGWKDWSGAADIAPLSGQAGAEEAALTAQAVLSATILKVHEDRDYPGALVASLSVPWGSSTNSLGGYHLVWPRDTVLTAFAFIAIGQTGDAAAILSHLVAAQQSDGHWHQNYYPDGVPFWTGIQLDEAALPILLAAKLHETGAPEPHGIARMVRRAAAFIARTGPGSPQDRWEENAGINPFTLACAIAALTAAAPWLSPVEAAAAQELADEWNWRMEEWCAVSDSRWTRETGAARHYIRLRPPVGSEAGSETVALRNRGGETIPAADLVAFEFSYLPRLGLRAASDPLVEASVRVADHVLGVETPSGRIFRRYNEDGYGETEGGGPFTGQGIGRLWPFITGERGHLALDAGEDGGRELRAMLACASAGGLLPEQVWDSDPIPERGLYPGRPSGSAMPLLWTHAEFLKLWAARRSGRPVERLGVVEGRYGRSRPRPKAMRWRADVPFAALPPDTDLVVVEDWPFTLHFGTDGWQDVREIEAAEGAFGLWNARVPAANLKGRSSLEFTRRHGSGWEGTDHALRISERDAA